MSWPSVENFNYHKKLQELENYVSESMHFIFLLLDGASKVTYGINNLFGNVWKVPINKYGVTGAHYI